jgi:hypothetical protein
MRQTSDRRPAPTDEADHNMPADVLAADDRDPPIPAGGRVDAGAATTGTQAGSSGQAPPGSVPGEDSAIDSDAV